MHESRQLIRADRGMRLLLRAWKRHHLKGLKVPRFNTDSSGKKVFAGTDLISTAFRPPRNW